MGITETITSFEVVDAHITHRLVDLHTSMPAIVQSYDHAANTCVVTPIFYRTLPDGDDNEVPGEPLPDLQDVPVQICRGGGFAWVHPLKAGDEVLLVFSERNLGNWRATGSAGDPGDLALHPLDGAVAVPSVNSNGKLCPLGDAVSAFLGHETTATGQLHFTADGKIELGTGAIEPILLGNATAQALEGMFEGVTAMFTTIAAYAAALTAAASTWAGLPMTAPAFATAVSGAGAAVASAMTAYGTAVSTYETAIVQAKSTTHTVS